MSVLFERYHIRLYNFFLGLGLKNDASQDLTQNLFYRMIKYSRSYREGSGFKTWMYQIARNLYTDYYNEKKRNEGLFVLSENYPSDISDEPGEFGEDEYRRLESAFSRLSDSQKEVLVLSRYEGLKYSEISVIINQSVPAIKVAIHRAIKELRTIYHNQIK